jgi:hypothetical protein
MSPANNLSNRVFATNIAPDPFVPKYGVTADGQRFLGLEHARGDQSFTFLLNWQNAKPASRLAR